MREKLVVAIISIFYLSCNIFASTGCKVGISKTCSESYFKAKNLTELESYLSSPVINPNGKQLGLEIDFNIEDKSISTGVACNLRIKTVKRLVATSEDLYISTKTL